MEGSYDSGDDVGTPNNGLVNSLVVQEDVKCDLVYVLAPGIWYDIPQNDPATDQFKLSNKGLADVDADPYEFEDLCCDSWRWAVAQQQQADPGKGNGGDKFLQQLGGGAQG